MSARPVPMSSSLLLGVCLDSSQLSAPVPRKHAAPVVDRAQRLGVDPVQGAPAVPPHVYKPDVSQHLQVLRHRRLPQLERVRDVGHRPLVAPDELEDVTPARLRNRVEGIRSRRGAGHETLYIPIWEYVKRGPALHACTRARHTDGYCTVTARNRLAQSFVRRT